MYKWREPFYQNDDHENSAGAEFSEAMEEEYTLQIEDPDTGELFDFILADQFEYNDDVYAVLLPDEEDPEEFFIVRVSEVGEDDSFVETLSDEEADEIYEAYDKILEDYFEENEEISEI